jgi:hypothetical protein
MPESQADRDQPERCGPAAPRRVVADWEYETAYIPTLQVRITAGSHNQLCEWAKQERTTPRALLVHILEEAVRRRGS